MSHFLQQQQQKTLSRVCGRMWLSVYSQRNSTSKLANRSVERKLGISAIPKSPSILDIRICQEQSIPSPRPPSISRTGRPYMLALSLSPSLWHTFTMPGQEQGMWPNPAAAQRLDWGHQQQTSQQ